MPDGILLVDKPAGCTSHDVVQRARRALKLKRIGHCGTLDPGATGLLILTLGQATRLTRFLIQAPKVYEGSIQFGSATDTYDALGQVTEEHEIGELSTESVEAAMKVRVGTYEQLAPAYSAKKVGGRKLYDLARKGEEVPESRKEITVFSFERTGEIVDGVLPFELKCSSGTYVRTVAHEIGQETGVAAHLATLRRTKIGPFSVAGAADGDALPAPEELREQAGFVDIAEIALPFSSLTLDAGQTRRIRHGQTVLIRDLEGEEGDWIQVFDARRRFVAVGSITERIGRGVAIVAPKIVFN